METWYKATPSHNWLHILPVTVEKVTEQSVLTSGRMRRKESTYECYYPTWKAAHAAIVFDKERAVEFAKTALDRAISVLDQARKMTEAKS